MRWGTCHGAPAVPPDQAPVSELWGSGGGSSGVGTTSWGVAQRYCPEPNSGVHESLSSSLMARSASASRDATLPPGEAFPVEVHSGLSRCFFWVSFTGIRTPYVQKVSGGVVNLFTVTAGPPPALRVRYGAEVSG
ncbi:hypothetical protein NDU88_005984 [Pleurodeles waltl]|uniref:Uncharacterized protein n=1 Tax=Pleurodeles waltl TaxID=8319 RepID=A0AAV7MEI0_PLEWA|nr:hypothetical protein NDU88_005984 [Pleurodeles waltl]